MALMGWMLFLMTEAFASPWSDNGRLRGQLTWPLRSPALSMSVGLPPQAQITAAGSMPFPADSSEVASRPPGYSTLTRVSVPPRLTDSQRTAHVVRLEDHEMSTGHLWRLAHPLPGSKSGRRLATPVMQRREPIAPFSVSTAGSKLSGGVVTGSIDEMIGSRVPAAVTQSFVVTSGSRRTWSCRNPSVERVKVDLGTSDGSSLDTDLELWHGPNETPCRLRVYIEEGGGSFSAVICTPRYPNTLAISNTRPAGEMEGSLSARVLPDPKDQPSRGCLAAAASVVGGGVRTCPIEAPKQVEVLLLTDGTCGMRHAACGASLAAWGVWYARWATLVSRWHAPLSARSASHPSPCTQPTRCA